jgi:hypothetical protein
MTRREAVDGCALLGSYLLVALFLGASLAAAQSPEGGLVGTVQDSTGGRLPEVQISVESMHASARRASVSSAQGEFRIEPLPPDEYRVSFKRRGWTDIVYEHVRVAAGSTPSLSVVMKPSGGKEVISVEGASSPQVEATSSVMKSAIPAPQIKDLPLAARSFANIAYIAPMTEPVEPSDPTKARITAVSFAGSSGLNVDLSVDGGDNNDDWIGGFLQNYSPDALQELVVRTAQFDADTSRTNGGSVIIVTRRGTDQWQGGGAFYERARALNARNTLDNPQPNPKQPFSRQNGVFDLGGPVQKQRLWFFSSLELVRENASLAYGALSLSQFRALAQLASEGQIAGVPSIDVPSSVEVPFRDRLFDARVDWNQSSRSQWFVRGAFDFNNTRNNLLQQGTLPSTGALTRAHYYSLLLNNQLSFSPNWLGSFTFQVGAFTNRQAPNSHLGLALAFPFSASYLTTSGFETFGDNQFVTPITAFPILRKQQKYQLRYDATRVDPDHALKFGVNLIQEPVLSGELFSNPERLVVFSQNPAYFLASGQSLQPIIENTAVTGGGNGGFSQNVQRLGLYIQDSWRVRPSLTFNYGLRYDTTFDLFRAEGRLQDQNPAVVTLRGLGIPLSPGIPHDYRRAFSPRLGFAYPPGALRRTVIRGGFGLYYNDLAQNGWVNAFQAVNEPLRGLLKPGDQGAIISPDYHTPYDLQASLSVEHDLGRGWTLSGQFEHHKGVHQYRRYEYKSGFSLPGTAPDVSVFRTDNRSRYDGFSTTIAHHGRRLDLAAHYTLASAATWGAVVGELFDYVNLVSNPLHAFGPGDYGPSGEDVRHRGVLAAVWHLPQGFQASALAQVESARPFTLFTPVDVNNDGDSANDRAVINGVQTSLDEFRGKPYSQVDMRVSRDFRVRENFSVRPFIEFFNLLNRGNPGNDFLTDLSAFPTPVNSLVNATAFCLNATCSQTSPITSPKQLRLPAGALGDFFGPGTTVGIPFAAQIGVRVTF